MATPDSGYTPNEQREQDNYLVCSLYEARVGDSKHDKHDDVIVFSHDNGLHYFATLDGNGGIALRSEGYPTTGARDTGLKSVLRNRDKRARYKLDEQRGLYYTCLTAQNAQEIGRSCPKRSEEEAMSLWPALGAAALAAQQAREADEAKAAEAKAAEAAALAAKPVEKAPAPAAAASSDGPNAVRTEDNYLVCSAYEARINDSKHAKHEDVIEFTHDNGLHYFATLDGNGGIALRSEGYPTTGARDTGLKSVLRNREKRARFKLDEQRGLYFTCLTAQNAQEIGRSCPKRSEAEAMALWPALGAAALAAQQAREADEAKAASLAAEPIVATPEPVVVPPATGPNAVRTEDNYMRCAEYEARISDSKHPKHGDVIVFHHENGLYYFATLDASDKIALRSEGYPTTGARDNGLKSVLRNREKRARFKTEERMGKHFTVLYAQNNQEIGRSCPKATADDATALMPGLSAAAAALAAAAAAPAPTPPPPPAPEPVAPAPEPEPADKEDDYLACKEYQGRKMNDRVNRVSLFKHSNGQFYFAIIGENDKVRLRSEGFRTAKQRDEELSGALRFIDDESKYERITRGKYHINVLHDETGREVGRSCAEREPVPFVPIVAAAPLAAAAAATAVVTPTPPPPPPPVVKKEPVAAVPPPVADKGGCAWWMWLLAALLLAALAWYFLRGCNDATPAVEQAAVTAPVETPPPPPPAPEPEPEPVVEAAPEPAPAPRPAPAAPIVDGECSGIAVGAEYNDAGIPLMPLGNYGGLAGDVQDYLRDGGQGSRSFSMSNVAFLPRGNDLAIEPCSVGDVDRLAAVLRNNPGAEITISVPSERNCQTLQRLLAYRGIDRSRITIAPSSANEILVTP